MMSTLSSRMRQFGPSRDYPYALPGEFSEEEEIDLEMIKAKFTSLSSALQETNQNLVTIEMLQDHYRCIFTISTIMATQLLK